MNSTSRIVISIVIIVLIAAVVGWIWFAANQDDNQTDTTTSTPTPTSLQQDSSPAANESGDESQSEDNDGIVKEIEVSNEGLNFTPETITVNRGDVVRIIYTSVGDTHTFTLPEFNADTGNVAAGEQATVEFVASAPGSFEFYCTPHRDMGMTGTLVVK